MRYVGHSVATLDGWEKVTGKAKYAADLSLPDMLQAKLLFSDYPHATIERLDTRRAERVSGVRKVITYETLSGMSICGSKLLRRYGQAIKDRPILAHQRVRFAGEPVAIVVAEDESAAREAVRRVEVDYAPLPVVSDIEAALSGDNLLHGKEPGYELTRSDIQPDFGRNICGYACFEAGNPGLAFQECDFVVQDQFNFPSLFHYPMEPHCAVGMVAKDSITVYSSTQAPFQVRDELAHIFGIDPERVRIIAPFVGGGFGAKGFVAIEPLAVAASAVAGAPVMVRLSQEETAYTTRRHPAEIQIRSGLNREGMLVCREVIIRLDTGAYADFGPQVTKKAAFRSAGPYRLKHARAECYAVYTNKLPSGAFRGIGSVQTAWACEAHTEQICMELRLDPIGFRLKNLLRAGERYVFGGPPLDGDPYNALKTCVDQYERLRQRNPGPNAIDPTIWRFGAGVACTMKDVSTAPYEAVIEAGTDGTFLISANAPEIGGGARTVLVQIAAEVLGVPMDAIRIAPADTAVTPPTSGVFGSRITVLMGGAVRQAAEELRNAILTRAAERSGHKKEILSVIDGQIVGPEKVLFSVAELAKRTAERLTAKGVCRPKEDAGAIDICTWEINAGVASVGVDTESGLVSLRCYVSAADVGRAVHPLKCEGQDEGAVMFGIGNTLVEEQRFEGGILMNANPIDYCVPKFKDLPDIYSSVLIENADGPGPFGSKGMAEGGLAPVAPAVAAAIRSASGILVDSLPITPERVFRRLTR
ncbi:MAG: xanthine dehydrogenase family protein molybdopterin-binding subunit [Deltaproteobacteria bacterium]|nr:xanthine dehydrogenase family protein molybdopterin-binding subunit [Deltaproteobacteria bacterium]